MDGCFKSGKGSSFSSKCSPPIHPESRCDSYDDLTQQTIKQQTIKQQQQQTIKQQQQTRKYGARITKLQSLSFIHEMLATSLAGEFNDSTIDDDIIMTLREIHVVMRSTLGQIQCQV